MMLAAFVALSSPALLLPSVPAPQCTALAACAQPRILPVWMQEAAGEPAEAGTAAEAEAGAEEAGTEAGAAAEEKVDPIAAEKKELREKISALEKQLVGARGELLEKQDAVKDAGARRSEMGWPCVVGVRNA